MRLVGDPVLRVRTDPVVVFGPRVEAAAESMLAVMRAEGGVGLAAPQVGLGLRMFVWDVGAGARVVVNPQVSECSGSQVGVEGCLSVPGRVVEVERPGRLRLDGFSPAGRPVGWWLSGLAARCVCHELDHLDGVLMIDRVAGAVRR